jgi:hypothetical protein
MSIAKEYVYLLDCLADDPLRFTLRVHVRRVPGSDTLLPSSLQ